MAFDDSLCRASGSLPLSVNHASDSRAIACSLTSAGFELARNLLLTLLSGYAKYTAWENRMKNVIQMLRVTVPALLFLVAANGQQPSLPKPAPEIIRLNRLFEGSWRTSERHEQSRLIPGGGAGKGTQTFRTGPGGLSLILENQSRNASFAFSGHGVLCWVRVIGPTKLSGSTQPYRLAKFRSADGKETILFSTDRPNFRASG